MMVLTVVIKQIVKVQGPLVEILNFQILSIFFLNLQFITIVPYTKKQKPELSGKQSVLEQNGLKLGTHPFCSYAPPPKKKQKQKTKNKQQQQQQKTQTNKHRCCNRLGFSEQYDISSADKIIQLRLKNNQFKK